jgi:hypothetical protein
MFTASSLAVGPIVVYYLIARSGDASALRTAMKFDQALERIAGVSMASESSWVWWPRLEEVWTCVHPWLLTAYALVILVVANNFYLGGRLGELKEATNSNDRDGAAKLSRAPALALSIALLGLLTLGLVYVMVAKPTLF